MKTTRLNSLTKSIFLGIFTIMVIFSIESCTSTVRFLSSTVVPGAQGSVKLKKDKNKNYQVQIEITDLAEISRLQQSKNSYVVWMTTDQEITKNIGQLVSSTSFFSKRHKASLETVSSFKPARIFVTAEDDPNVQYPGMQVVLTTDRFK